MDPHSHSSNSLHHPQTIETDWQPRPTIGPVPRRAEKYRFSPISLPKPPSCAKDPRVLQLSKQLMADIKRDCKADLPDPWARVGLWQQHPYFSTGHKIRLAFPGLGLAFMAFSLYLGLEYLDIIPKKQNPPKRQVTKTMGTE